MKIIFFSLILVVCSSPAQAEKIRILKNALKEECSMEKVPRKMLVRLLRDVFLRCAKGEKVDVSGSCQISCLKESKGHLMGRITEIKEL